MIEVGVKELKNNLSRYLSRVRRGELVRVTMRGEHVADLVPSTAARESWQRELIAAGRLSPASLPTTSRAPRPAKLDYSLSERLIAEREEENR
jgi:prevent-host-death family protein